MTPIEQYVVDMHTRGLSLLYIAQRLYDDFGHRGSLVALKSFARWHDLKWVRGGHSYTERRAAALAARRRVMTATTTTTATTPAMAEPRSAGEQVAAFNQKWKRGPFYRGHNELGARASMYEGRGVELSDRVREALLAAEKRAGGRSQPGPRKPKETRT